MYTAKIENANGEIMTLTGNEAAYQITNITGLDPPAAQVNSSTAVGLDGALFNSSKLNTRNVVITIRINGDVEANRLELYRYFKTKERCRFYFQNDTLNVYIDGYINNFTCGIFSAKETAQISIICLYPYFSSMTENRVAFENAVSLFNFPFSINIGNPVAFSNLNTDGKIEVYNESDETGAIIEITVKNAIESIKLLDANSGNAFSLYYLFQPNDNIIIDTAPGQKSITLIRGIETINLFSALQRGSVFFQLRPGSNIFMWYANDVINSQDISVTISYCDKYRGV